MRKSTMLLALVFALLVVLGSGSSYGWELRSEIPESVEAGQPIVLDLWEWLASGDCDACRGYEVVYGELGAEVILSIERTRPLGDPCHGPGDICEYLVEVIFEEPGTQVLVLVERVIASVFGGDTVLGEFSIEVEAQVPNAATTWGAIKAVYR